MSRLFKRFQDLEGMEQKHSQASVFAYLLHADLSQPIAATTISKEIKLNRNRVDDHLAWLEKYRFITVRKDGLKRFYTISPESDWLPIKIPKEFGVTQIRAAEELADAIEMQRKIDPKSVSTNVVTKLGRYRIATKTDEVEK